MEPVKLVVGTSNYSSDNSDDDRSNLLSTPEKILPGDESDDSTNGGNKKGNSSPLTPTYNLKMLTRVASEETPLPETPPCRRLKLGDVFKDETNKLSLRDRYFKIVSGKTPRRDRSLKQLCKRFLDKYPLNINQCRDTEICLNIEADSLEVERRRIYDIIAVMEALNIAAKKCKNVYIWQGNSKLIQALTQLKLIGHQKNIQKLVEDYSTSASIILNLLESNPNEYYLTENTNFKRSLMSLTQHFVIIFLSMKHPKFLTLDLVAKIMDFLGPPSKYPTHPKTVTRRLYDVANILCSLDLVAKTLATCSSADKTGFYYIGPDPKLDACCDN